MPFLLSSIRWCIEILSSFDCETAAQMLSCVFVFCFCSLYCFITPKGCHSYLQNRHCEIELVTFAGVAACVMHSGTRWWLRVGKSEVINVGCRHLCFTWSAAHITYLCLSCATVAAGGWSGSEISPRSVVLCAVWVIRSRIRNIHEVGLLQLLLGCWLTWLAGALVTWPSPLLQQLDCTRCIRLICASLSSLCHTVDIHTSEIST